MANILESPSLVWATPVILTPDGEDNGEAITKMIERSKVTDSFLSGEISIADFFDYLDDEGYDLENYLDTVNRRLEDASLSGRVWL